jgi:hypothetical protein
VVVWGRGGVAPPPPPPAELWPKLVAEVPQLGEFQAATVRQISVFMLTVTDARMTRP